VSLAGLARLMDRRMRASAQEGPGAVTTTNQVTDPAAYAERRVPRGAYTLYARDYPGASPAYVLMHGFPDNLRIYEALAPLLAGAGRRAVAFDFLGYGRSDKPADSAYTAANLEGDLQAVVAALRLLRGER
jgi:pimeloyl-ACP methyl ester carboxylesterase